MRDTSQRVEVQDRFSPHSRFSSADDECVAFQLNDHRGEVLKDLEGNRGGEEVMQETLLAPGTINQPSRPMHHSASMATVVLITFGKGQARAKKCVFSVDSATAWEFGFEKFTEPPCSRVLQLEPIPE
ncbi:hypothetical protein ZHAS_00006199 [Anopheles sinensis]|uniref:Uncharacterized protein n=1 Tax=Anopheles sinensis TaxID=74873 RepID=A0A084VLP1_ANOSI|nr:hypothetical protein ZHAS_00006199 [Anopheles sinensis]